MLKRIIEKISENGGIMFPPASKEDLFNSNFNLKKEEFTQIPLNYANLLGVTDGFIWDGLELYGIKRKIRENYTIPSLEDFNLEFKPLQIFKSKILLGRTAEAIFIYNAKTKRYEIVNRVDFAVIDSFNNLSDTLYLYVEGLFE